MLTRLHKRAAWVLGLGIVFAWLSLFHDFVGYAGSASYFETDDGLIDIGMNIAREPWRTECLTSRR
ncbi:MAG: hypothetical protein QF787_12315 [Nitrospinota bacterium]|jgi:hypothetical protein|nr:hypothetical protein [Rhodospirillaceae bacterium]MDP6366913.1 hypothetical protein [Nitrospinota bacterium]|tara:strand:+ start:4133 stop:4330 length:198 start_codon:yes stop_codon:yes gene_type:complete